MARTISLFDGRQVVFRSQRDGNFDVYIMNIDGTNGPGTTAAPGSRRMGRR